MIVIFVLDHFWGHIFERTTECVSLLHVIRLDAPAEVTNFDDVTILNEDVFWLNISVD